MHKQNPSYCEATSLETQLHRFGTTSFGDISQMIDTEIRSLLREARGNRPRATKMGLQRLLEYELITAHDQQRLEKVSDTLFAAIGGKQDAITAYRDIQAIYQQLVLDKSSSPVAVLLANNAQNSFVAEAPNPDQTGVAFSIVVRSPGTAAGFIGGMVGGFVGGLIAGGGAGAIVGAFVGGIVGGVVGYCAEGDDADVDVEPPSGGGDTPPSPA
jgi:hypothetical protein